MGALSPFDFDPDVIWYPKVQPLTVGGTPIYVFNLLGILFYTNDKDKFDKVINNLLLVGATAVSAAYLLLTFKDLLALASQGGIRSIPDLLAGEEAILSTEVGVATVNASEGGP